MKRLWKKTFLVTVIAFVAYLITCIEISDVDLELIFSSNATYHKCFTECTRNYTTTCYVRDLESIHYERLKTGEIVLIASPTIDEVYSKDHPDDIWLITRIKWVSEYFDGPNWVLYRKQLPSEYKVETYPISFPQYKRHTGLCIWIERPYDSCKKYCQ